MKAFLLPRFFICAFGRRFGEICHPHCRRVGSLDFKHSEFKQKSESQNAPYQKRLRVSSRVVTAAERDVVIETFCINESGFEMGLTNVLVASDRD